MSCMMLSPAHIATVAHGLAYVGLPFFYRPVVYRPNR